MVEEQQQFNRSAALSGSTTPSTTTSNNRASVTRQACDGCRVRKIKCDISIDDLSSPGRSVSIPPTDGRQCRRCSRLDIPCTFLLPVGVRGPRKKDLKGPPKAGTRLSFSSVAPIREDSVQGPQLMQSPNSLDDSQNQPQFRMERAPSGAGSSLSLMNHQNSPQSVISGHSPGIFAEGQYPTDLLCSRPLLNCILNDYLDLLYPLIPVVHRPSFRRDLANSRDVEDPDFLGLIVCMCAVFVGIMPRKFREYRSSATHLQFQTRTEMINYCYDMFLGLRGADYFDEINYQKWAASYCLAIAFFQIGKHNKARMVEVEAMQLARLLELHQISNYDGLNCIETQLRKKGFWLMFYGYVHSQLQNLRKERLTFLDPPILNTINLEVLMPIEVDDEMIHENVVLPQPANELSLVTGFNVSSRIFWAALTSNGFRNAAQDQNCDCVRSKNPKLQFAHLEQRLHTLKYMLDDGVPYPLRQWATRRIDELESTDWDQKRVIKAQFESMRANIHVTHLWLQSIISDQIETLRLSELERENAVASSAHARTAWREREDICRQLLHVLHSIEGIHLEPNGHHLTCKVRDVAVTLLACPFDPHEEVSKRANEYLLEFTNILSRLDGSETMNTLSLQSWVDTDRNGGPRGWYGR